MTRSQVLANKLRRRANWSGFLVTLAMALVLADAIDFARRLFVEHERNVADERAVAVLPEGVEAAWLAFVRRQVDAHVRRVGDVLLVNGFPDANWGRTTYLSTRTPFSVNCDPFLATVTFDTGSYEDVEVWIYGAEAADCATCEAEPDMPVSRSSEAARRLSVDLCRRIAEAVAALSSDAIR